MKVLFVTGEASPYIASGGLGDVMGALPAALNETGEDIEAEVILPLYNSVRVMLSDELEKVIDIRFRLSWRETGATVYRHRTESVTYYFIDNQYYFDRPMMYGEFDDGERFAFFSMAVIEYIIQSGNVPNILHANDWQSALSVIYLKTKYREDARINSIRTVYTIHNIEYQGKFDINTLSDVFALDNAFVGVVEYKGNINLTKGAMTVSDYITTVSPNYANELHHDFFAFGLADIVSSLSHKMCGIINGIDYTVFSPAKDTDIYAPYTKRGYKSGKAKNKKALQTELGLAVLPETPLITMVTRLTEGKGIDLFLHIADELLSENIQIVILGTGEKKYEDALCSLSEKYENFKAIIKFDRVLSKKLYAAADLFLMPSKSEPCGLAQMIACSYGTPPIVRAVGGLYDTILPYGDEGSNGFRFDNYNAHDLLYTVKHALLIYQDKTEWSNLVKRSMSSDFSWNASALKYLTLYNNLLNW